MTSNPLNTPKGFRYPIYTDSPDVPRDLGNLATDIDSYLSLNKGPGYLVYSFATITIGLGTKTFTTPRNTNNPNGSGAYLQGSRVRVVDTTNSTRWVEGIITSTTLDTSITISVDSISGSGSYSSWSFSLSGIQGIQGPQGPQGPQGAVGPQGPQGNHPGQHR